MLQINYLGSVTRLTPVSFPLQRHKTTYPDIVIYRSICVTLGQAGHMKELFDVIDSMRSMPKSFKIQVHDDWDPRIEPDIVIYNAVSALSLEYTLFVYIMVDHPCQS